jgi:hypothetical protein
MKPNALTYRKFLDSVCVNCRQPIITEDANAIIKHFKPAREVVMHAAATTFLLDYATKRYIHVGEGCFNVLGYTASWFMESGLEEYLSRWHPDDYIILNTKVFADNMAFLRRIPKEDVCNYIVSYNYRMRNPFEKYIMILQRFSFIPGAVAYEPAGVVGIALDISHYKNDNSIVHTIEKVAATDQGNVTELVFKKIHPVYDTELPPN